MLCSDNAMQVFYFEDWCERCKIQSFNSGVNANNRFMQYFLILARTWLAELADSLWSKKAIQIDSITYTASM